MQVQADTGAFPDWGKLFSDEEIADQASTPINATESQVDQQMMEGTGTQEDAPAIFTESQVDQQMMEGTGTQEDAPAIFSNPQIPTEGFNLRMPWEEFNAVPKLNFFGPEFQMQSTCRIASRKKFNTQNYSVGDREAEAEVPAAGTSPSLGSGCTGPLSMMSSKAVEAGSPPRGGRRQMFSSNPRAAAFPAAGSCRRARDTSSCRSHRIKTIADQPSMRRGQSSANSSSQNNLSAEVLAKRMKLHESQVT